MNNTALRRVMAHAPMAWPLAAVLAGILGSWWWFFGAAALVSALWVRRWRVALAVLLCAVVSGGQGALVQRQTAVLRQAVATGNAVVRGTVTRVYARSCVLQPAGMSPALLLQGAEGAALGDVLRVRVLPAEEEAPPLVHGMFDRRAWFRGEGIAFAVQAAETEFCGHPWSWAALRGMGLQGRDILLSRLLPPGRESDVRRQVLGALLLGAKDAAENETLSLFRRSGCLHAFAVSGLHVGAVALFVLGVFARLRVRPVVAHALLPLLLAVYVLVTGCSVSALRAYVMLTAWSAALVLRRFCSPANIWCAAACLLLLVRPCELFNAGFLLSFSVYAAIVAGVGFCLRHDRPWFGPDAYIPFRIRTAGEMRVAKLESCLRGTVLVSLWAWLMSVPVSCFCFHSFSPWSFLTNIAIALPLLVAMFCGAALLLLAGVPLLGALAGWLADASAGVLLAVVAWFAALPGAYVAARPAAPQEAVAIWPVGNGRSACMLGNPGLLVHNATAGSMRYTVAPAVFHAGFRPAAVLCRPVSARSAVSEAVLQEEWPQICLLSPDRPATLQTAAGRYTLYPPSAELPPVPQGNRLPVIMWERPDGHRTLYIGDAAAAAVESLPPGERRADTLILGAHPTLPADALIDPADFGNPEVILLPSARQRRAEVRAEQSAGAEE